MEFKSYIEQIEAAPDGNPPINVVNHIPPVHFGSDSNFVNGKKIADIINPVPLYEIKEDKIINGNSEGKSVSLHIKIASSVAEKTISEKQNRKNGIQNVNNIKNNLFIKSPV